MNIVEGADAVSVRSLTKVYKQGLLRGRRVRALDGVSLAVERGQIFGLLGPNGAGKTTMVKILLGICHKTSGEAHLLGVPAPNASVRRFLGYLPESHRFPQYLTAFQAIDHFAALAGMGRSERRARGRALLDRVGILKDADRKLRGYSKGMLQRFGLAQSLVNDPLVVLLDEPTDGVDPIGRREIRDMLVELRKQGKTVLVSSHILSEIELVCDRICVLDRGRLIHEGSVAEMTERRGEWEVGVTRASADLTDAIRAKARFATPRQDGTGYVVGVGKDDEIDAVVDAIRAKGVGIRELVPHRSTLEDRVIDLLRSGGIARMDGGPARAGEAKP